jgi:hypothetical protein
MIMNAEQVSVRKEEVATYLNKDSENLLKYVSRKPAV